MSFGVKAAVQLGLGLGFGMIRFVAAFGLIQGRLRVGLGLLWAGYPV